MAKLFTEAELEELRRADAEIEEGFTLTQEDLNFSRNLDREAKLDKLDNHGRKIAAQQAAYREANREKWNAYQREYRRKRREEQKKSRLPVCKTGKQLTKLIHLHSTYVKGKSQYV